MKALTAGVPYDKIKKYVKLIDSNLEKEMTEAAFRSHSKEGKVPDIFDKYSLKNVNSMISDCTKHGNALKILGMRPMKPKEAAEIDALVSTFGTKDEYGGVSIIDRKTANTVDEILGGAAESSTESSSSSESELETKTKRKSKKKTKKKAKTVKKAGAKPNIKKKSKPKSKKKTKKTRQN